MKEDNGWTSLRLVENSENAKGKKCSTGMKTVVKRQVPQSQTEKNQRFITSMLRITDAPWTL